MLRDFKLFKEYLKKYKLNRFIPLIDKAVKKTPMTFSGAWNLGILVGSLNEAACEPLWRDLWNTVVATQEGYPERADLCDTKKLSELRLEIEEKFHELGYSGAYPEFRKKAPLKGLHIDKSYDQSYFVGFHKNTEYLIKCEESFFNDEIYINFLCGTAQLKKNEELADFYSFTFDAKGKRLFKKVYGTELSGESFETVMTVAAKKAELKRLTKIEKSADVAYSGGSLMDFLSNFILFGGLFAVAMTLGFILICIVITAIFLRASEITEMLTAVPWGLIFGLSFVGFGLPMAIIETISHRK